MYTIPSAVLLCYASSSLQNTKGNNTSLGTTIPLSMIYNDNDDDKGIAVLKLVSEFVILLLFMCHYAFPSVKAESIKYFN